MENELTGNGVTTFHGHAEFTGTNELTIDGTAHRSDRFLIASGATPRTLDFPGAGNLIDSTGFLDLDQLPQKIVFIGGGFISFEFAHIAARAGADCVIIDRGPRPLREFDPDLVELPHQPNRAGRHPCPSQHDRHRSRSHAGRLPSRH